MSQTTPSNGTHTAAGNQQRKKSPSARARDAQRAADHRDRLAHERHTAFLDLATLGSQRDGGRLDARRDDIEAAIKRRIFTIAERTQTLATQSGALDVPHERKRVVA